MIHKHMSIPEFMSLLDLGQLRMVKEMAQEKIDKITDKEKVEVWVFSSGMVNEGFYKTKEEALQAAKDYANSKEYSIHDTLKIFRVFEYPEEAKRLLED